MSGVDDLAAFVRARLDEDAEAARACASAPWEIEIPPMIHVSVQARRDNKWKWGMLGYVATVERDEDRAHIVRHDPERVLADIEAKREVVRLAERAHDYHQTFMNGFAAALEGALRLFAQAYADHPEYKESWRP